MYTQAITLLGSIATVAVTYWFTKKREREAEWRKEKLSYYKAFIHSLSGVVKEDATDEGKRLFAKTSNDLLLFAPPNVLKALYALRDEVSISNTSNRSIDKDMALLTALIHEIRVDLGISTGTISGFTAKLWCSGINNNTKIEKHKG